MWLGKKLFTLVIGIWLMVGLITFAGCGKKDTSDIPETSVPAEQVQPEQVQPEPEPAPPVKEEMVTNGTFEAGIDGWVLAGGKIKTDADGNKYFETGNNWQNYQILKLEPNTAYTLNAGTRKNTGEREARFKVIFFDINAQRLGWYNFIYKHQGTGWESIPPQTIEIPEGTAETIIYLLADGETDIHDFDNISLTKEAATATPVAGTEITIELNTSRQITLNAHFDNHYGWSGLNNRIVPDSTGNKCLANGYNWDVCQSFAVIPGSEYTFTAKTKKGTAGGPARFVITFLDQHGQRLESGYNFSYTHQGTEWEKVPAETIAAPSGAEKAVLYILSDDSSTGVHYFDDIYVTQAE